MNIHNRTRQIVHTNASAPRGFTLLIAVVLSSVILALGLTLLDIAFKQTQLASSAKNSQYAFYAADSGLECLLYYDQQLDSFNYTTAPTSFLIDCFEETDLTVDYPAPSGGVRTASVNITCNGDSSQMQAIGVVTKAISGTTIYANGYNVCDTEHPRRVERGLKIRY